jgi:probable phosphoglycerate mutase
MQGHSDSPLSEVGVLQARLLAQRLAKMKFDVLYSSDSGRAQSTARSIADATGHELVVDSRLRERHFGIFEGLTGPEIQARHPDAYALWRTRDPAYVVPGGESLLAFRERAQGCLNEIAMRHPQELVVVVTHGLVLDLIYRAANGIALEEPRVHELVNAGINRLRFDAGTWHIEVWGDGSHLENWMLT